MLVMPPLIQKKTIVHKQGEKDMIENLHDALEEANTKMPVSVNIN